MSLVAYNASDESDGEESDEGFLPDSVAQTQVAKRLNSAFGHISDEDEYETVSSTSVATDYSVSSASGTGGTNFIMGLTTPNVGLVDSTSVASLEGRLSVANDNNHHYCSFLNMERRTVTSIGRVKRLS